MSIIDGEIKQRLGKLSFKKNGKKEDIVCSGGGGASLGKVAKKFT